MSLTTTQPHIVFILIDDLGWRDLACYGSSFYETPNLDHLAERGMRFTNAYAACPVCSPTRAAIQTGKYPARLGLTQYIGGANFGKLLEVPYLHYLPKEETTIASALRDGGYQTWHVGKWHLGDEDFFPEHHGYDINIGGCHHGGPFLPGYGSIYFQPQKLPAPGAEHFKEGDYLPDCLTDSAVALIKNRKKDQPFFLHYSQYAVHTPLEAPQDLVAKYEAKAQALKLDQIETVVTNERFRASNHSERFVERRIMQSHPTYAAMVENMDANVGRLLQSLEDEGILDQTLVIFTSDNGGLATAEGSPTCNAPLCEGKGWNYEGGTRVCQIAQWPNHIRPGSICHENTTSTDVYPTLLEAAGLPLRPDQHKDGVSILKLLTEEHNKLEREAIFWHYPHYSNQGGAPAASVRMGDWKLIENFEDNTLELYNLSEDISEAHNVVDQFPDITNKLKACLDAWKQDVEASIPERNPDWKPYQPAVANNACE